MKNLLQETIEELNKNNKTENDVIWVGNENAYSTWEHFKEVSDVEYSNGYGAQIVATDLIIVGDNWWLERQEYDGSEWWEYKQMPLKPTIRYDFEYVIGGMWSSLEEINE